MGVLIIKKIMFIGLLVLLVMPICFADSSYYYNITVEKSYDTYFNGMRFDDIEVFVNGEKESRVDEEGGKIDAAPDDEIIIRYKIESVFDSQSTIRISDVDVKVVIRNVDPSDGSDYERRRQKPFDLDAGERENDEMKIQVPDRIDEDKYIMTILADGKDDSGEWREAIVNFTLDVGKNSNEIKLKRKSISSQGYCEGLAYISIELVNTGDDDEDVYLKIFNPELDIYFSDQFEMDDNPTHDDNKYYETFKIRNPRLDVESRSYPISIKIESSSALIEDTVTLTVPVCENTTETYNQIQQQMQKKQEELTNTQPEVVENSHKVEVTYSNMPAVPISGFTGSDSTVEEKKYTVLTKYPKIVLFVLMNLGLLLLVVIVIRAALKGRRRKY